MTEECAVVGLAQRTSLVAQVIGQLRDEIAAGRWQVGSRIPPEPQLTTALGVGRNTVREAVGALCHAGLLESRQGDGTYVRARTELTGVLRDGLADAERGEVFEVRNALEAQAAQLAAARRTSGDLRRLAACQRRRAATAAEGDAAAFVEADVAFHRAVVGATHNTVLTDLYAKFGEMLRDSVRASVGSAEPRVNHLLVPHEQLLDAIRAGDVLAAGRAATELLARADAARDHTGLR